MVKPNLKNGDFCKIYSFTEYIIFHGDMKLGSINHQDILILLSELDDMKMV